MRKLEQKRQLEQEQLSVDDVTIEDHTKRFGALSILSLAAGCGDVALVTDLLNQGANPNEPSASRRIPAAIQAAAFGHVGVLKLLLSRTIGRWERLSGPGPWRI